MSLASTGLSNRYSITHHQFKLRLHGLPLARGLEVCRFPGERIH
jgi:hypothetical protein